MILILQTKANAIATATKKGENNAKRAKAQKWALRKTNTTIKREAKRGYLFTMVHVPDKIDFDIVVSEFEGLGYKVTPRHGRAVGVAW